MERSQLLAWALKVNGDALVIKREMEKSLTEHGAVVYSIMCEIEQSALDLARLIETARREKDSK